ncbi:DUF2220 domain-containing protein [Corynebacterium pseudogenitalium]|uniref:Wadjet anti-phage system protein JetD domain-containing protein n=1 Tax=Corynebacterium tuberculostearicum TaxID=38304 RepID=UPI001FCA5BC0|nr:Wadjet anti-phage system protein JetD domain-containing protein [Corynebacterium tuberculostearicum]MCG7457933.1 DUF2220 domain-containing protein [Corynebacterium tuberculostearicum]
MNWLNHTDTTYWSELYATGFATLNAVQAHFTRTRSLLMEHRHRRRFPALRRSRPSDGFATLPHLITEEQRTYLRLFTGGRLRSEQERTQCAHASAEIRTQLSQTDMEHKYLP